MVVIVLHSSKTMRAASSHEGSLNRSEPPLMAQTRELANYIKRLSVKQIQDSMQLSPSMAHKTHDLIQGWDENAPHLPAIDSFRGDIYSGLQVPLWTAKDREYAQQHLYILSGMYGVLRALDTIQPYRLEMGYSLPRLPGAKRPITKLYEFWGDLIAKQFPSGEPIINLSAKEYTKAVFPFFKMLDAMRDTVIISPKFLTVHPKTSIPTFVTVHAKIARGAFARWLIQKQINSIDELSTFHELGYKYDPTLSTFNEPVFVAQEFQGLGLSVRLR